MADNYKLSIIIETKTDAAKNNVDQLNGEFGELLKTLGKTPEFAKDFSKLATEMFRTGQVTEGVDDQTRALLNSYKHLVGMAKSRDILGLVPHKEIARQIHEVEKAFNTLKQSGTLSQKEIAQAALVAQGRMRELREQTNGITSSLALARREIAGLAAAGGGLAFAVKQAMDLESAMAEVAKTTDLADDVLARFSKEIQHLTREIPMSAEELAKLAAAGGQLGIAAGDLEEFTRLAAVMGTAFTMSAEESSNAVAKLMNVFDLSIGQVRALGDDINVLGNNTAATERGILEVMTRIGGTSQQFGLAADQAAALSAAMISLGKSPEVAATGINSFLSKLQTANVAGPEFQAALKGIGIDAVKLARDIRENPQKAIEHFLSTLQKLDKQARAETLTKLFGQEHQDDIAALVGGLDQYQKALDLVADKAKNAGAMQREFEARMKTAEAQLQLLKNGAIEAATNIGSLFLPAVTRVTQGLTEGTHAIADFAAQFPLISTLATSLATAAAVAGGLKLAIAAARVATAGLAQDALLVGRNFNLSIGQATHAIGKLNAAVAVLSSFMIGWDFGTYLVENFELVRKAGILMVETTVKGFEYIQLAWESVQAIFSDDTIEEAIARHEKRLADMDGIFASMYVEAEKAVDGAGKKTEKAGKEVADNAKKMAEDAARGITDTVGAAAAGAEALAQQASASVTRAGREMMGLLKNLQETGKTTGQIVTDALRKISEPDLEFSKLSELLQPLVKMSEESNAAADAIDKELAAALSRLTAGELADFQGRVEAAFAMAGEGAEKFKFILDAGLSASLVKLGVDVEKFKSGMSTAAKEAVELFSNVALQAGATSEQITAAFDAMIQKMDSLEAISRAWVIIDQLGRDGKLSVDQVTEALERLKKAAESVPKAFDAVEQSWKDLGLQSAKELDGLAAKARKAFETIKQSGTATPAEIERAWVRYAETAIEAARAHGESQVRATEATLKTQAAVLGLKDALREAGIEAEKTGEKAETAGKKATNAFQEAIDAARAYKAAHDIAEKPLSASVLDNPDDWYGKKETGTGSNDFSASIPNWDAMSEEARRETAEALKIAQRSPSVETYMYAMKEQGEVVGRVEAAIQSLAALKDRIEGKEMDNALALMIEASIAGFRGVLKDDMYADLESALSSYRSQSRSDRRDAGTQPAPAQAPPIAAVESPVQKTVSAQPDQAETAPRETVIIRREPAPRETATAVPTDNRLTEMLARLATLLSDIGRDVSTIAGAVTRQSQSTPPRLSSNDLAAGMLSALAEASTRS